MAVPSARGGWKGAARAGSRPGGGRMPSVDGAIPRAPVGLAETGGGRGRRARELPTPWWGLGAMEVERKKKRKKSAYYKEKRRGKRRRGQNLEDEEIGRRRNNMERTPGGASTRGNHQVVGRVIEKTCLGGGRERGRRPKERAVREVHSLSPMNTPSILLSVTDPGGEWTRRREKGTTRGRSVFPPTRAQRIDDC